MVRPFLLEDAVGWGKFSRFLYMLLEHALRVALQPLRHHLIDSREHAFHYQPLRRLVPLLHREVAPDLPPELDLAVHPGAVTREKQKLIDSDGGNVCSHGRGRFRPLPKTFEK